MVEPKAEAEDEFEDLSSSDDDSVNESELDEVEALRRRAKVQRGLQRVAVAPGQQSILKWKVGTANAGTSSTTDLHAEPRQDSVSSPTGDSGGIRQCG